MSGEPSEARGTRYPELTRSSPTGNLGRLVSCGSSGPQQLRASYSGVLSADRGRPPTVVQGRPCYFRSLLQGGWLRGLSDKVRKVGDNPIHAEPLHLADLGRLIGSVGEHDQALVV